MKRLRRLLGWSSGFYTSMTSKGVEAWKQDPQKSTNQCHPLFLYITKTVLAAYRSIWYVDIPHRCSEHRWPTQRAAHQSTWSAHMEERDSDVPFLILIDIRLQFMNTQTLYTWMGDANILLWDLGGWCDILTFWHFDILVVGSCWPIRCAVTRVGLACALASGKFDQLDSIHLPWSEESIMRGWQPRRQEAVAFSTSLRPRQHKYQTTGVRKYSRA